MFRIKVKQVININILPSPIKKIQYNKEKQTVQLNSVNRKNTHRTWRPGVTGINSNLV